MSPQELAGMLAVDCLNSGKDVRMFAENFERDIKRGDVAAAETSLTQIADAARRVQMYATDALRSVKQTSV